MTSKPTDKAAADDDAAILKAVKEALGDKVSDVRASQRLTESAACLVAGAQGARPRARAPAGAAEPRQRRQAHPRAQHAARPGEGARVGAVTAARTCADLATLLLDQAHILDGEVPADPAAFARRLNAFVVRGLRKG